MEVLFDPEEKILCPYNKSHYIMRKRMTLHLVKCKRSHPDVKLVECDFNSNHKIPEPELKYHHDHCPDKKRFEIACYQEVGQDLNKFPVVPLDIPTEENWDDTFVPTYEPEKFCEKKLITRNLDVASAAERRNFRNLERKRLAALNAEIENVASASNNKASGPSGSRGEPSAPVLPSIRSSAVCDQSENIKELLQTITIRPEKHFVPKV